MFGKLQKKVYVNMFIIPMSFVVVMSSITFIFVNRFITSEYEGTARESVSLSSTNFNFYMDILKSDLRLLTIDNDVVTYADSGVNPVLAQNKLNSAVSSNSAVLGITLYGTAASIHIASSGVSGYASLDILDNEATIASFLADETSEMLLLRNTNIPDNFDFRAYDESYGILSYFLKVYDDTDTFRGLVAADLDSTTIYALFFDYSDYATLDNVVTLISDDAIYLKSTENADSASFLSASPVNAFTRIDTHHSVLKTALTDDYSLVTIIDNDYYNVEAWVMSLAILGIDLLLCTADYLVTRKMAQYILTPLNDIVDKMKNQK